MASLAFPFCCQSSPWCCSNNMSIDLKLCRRRRISTKSLTFRHRCLRAQATNRRLLLSLLVILSSPLLFQPQHHQPPRLASRMAATEPPRSILMQRPRRWTTAHLKLAKVQPTAAASPAQMLGAEYIPADGDSGTLNAFSWWNTSHA